MESYIGLARKFVWVFLSHLMEKREGAFWPPQASVTGFLPSECFQGLSTLKPVSVLHSFFLLCNPLKIKSKVILLREEVGLQLQM